MAVLVTGGAGYIGAHIVQLLCEKGEDVVVVDDLSTGDPRRVPKATVIAADIARTSSVEILVSAMRKYGVKSVIHMAARKQVGESMERPAWYFQQNVGGLANVLMAMEQSKARDLIFSSSAAVYGMPDLTSVHEVTPLQPINPYGESKVVGEWMVRDASRAWGLRGASLRYFNVAGAGSPTMGDPAVLNLVPLVIQSLVSRRPPRIFGADYDTPDGTCIRDYVHVEDLANAHLAALEDLSRGLRRHDVFNVGTGQGASVREVIDLLREVTGIDIEPTVEARRPGDPPQLIGQVDRIRDTLGWSASHDLRDIIESAWASWKVLRP